MNALSAVMCNLVGKTDGPVTNDTGGTSRGNAGGGGGSSDHDPTAERPITAGDQAGAGLLTATILLSLVIAAVLITK